LKPTLRTMVEEEEGQYRSWANTQPAKTKAEIKEFEAIVSDQQNKFWKQMSFMVECLQPASQALRLMDQSRIRAKDVNNIWNGLEKRLTLTLADDRFKDTDQGLKVKVLQQFVEERERAQYPVFDAAWALDPCNHAELLRLGQSSEAVDLQKWRIIQDNTEHTLLTIACRKIKVDDPEVRKAIKRLKLDKEDKEDQQAVNRAKRQLILEKAKKHSDAAAKEFLSYCSGSSHFAKADFTLEFKEFWIKYGMDLKASALIILNIACTISDIERLHKVYSTIHTSSRNRLLNGRVDELSTARVARRLLNQVQKPVFDGVVEFGKLTDNEKLALIRWSQQAASADCAVQRTLLEPTTTTRVDPVPDLPETDSNTELATEEVENETEVEPDPEPDLAVESDEQGQGASTAAAAAQTTRSGRKVTFSRAFVRAGAELGLSADFFE